MVSRTPWFPGEKAVVIYNGIDFGVYDGLRRERAMLRASLREFLGLRANVPLITLVGELNERKGHRFVLRAAGEVLKRVPKARFVFVGEGDARDTIEAMRDELGLRDKIFLLGFREDIPAILTASDILVLPSRVEGFGYVLVEAMAARLPVVASDVSSIPEIVEDGATGFLHPVGAEDAIAAKLIALLTDGTLVETMGEAGYRAAAEKFPLDTMVDNLEKLFFAVGARING
jgi:glycosyltransferase involved in cell wall biosynthesis